MIDSVKSTNFDVKKRMVDCGGAQNCSVEKICRMHSVTHTLYRWHTAQIATLIILQCYQRSIEFLLVHSQ